MTRTSDFSPTVRAICRPLGENCGSVNGMAAVSPIASGISPPPSVAVPGSVGYADNSTHAGH